jgi:hypothetical protein
MPLMPYNPLRSAMLLPRENENSCEFMKSNVNVGKTVKFSKLALSFLAVLTLCFPERASAAKAVFERTKPHVNIGTIGHTHSSRTTLLAALAYTFHRPLLYKQFPWDDPDGTGHLRAEALYTAGVVVEVVTGGR